MALIWRGLAVVVVFVGCGLFVAKLVIARSMANGIPSAQVHLAGAMAGLFAGGAAATVVLLLVAFSRRR